VALALGLAQSRFARTGSVWIETLAEARSGRWLIKVDCKFIDEQIGHKLMSEQRQWVVVVPVPWIPRTTEPQIAGIRFWFWIRICICTWAAAVRNSFVYLPNRSHRSESISIPVNRHGDKRAVVVNTRTTSASAQSFLRRIENRAVEHWEPRIKPRNQESETAPAEICFDSPLNWIN